MSKELSFAGGISHAASMASTAVEKQPQASKENAFRLSFVAGLGLLLLAAALRVLAYPPFGQGWCIWLTLIPLYLLVRNKGWWQLHPFFAGWLGGLLWFGGTLWWIGHVTVLGTAALVAYLALYPAIWLWAVAAWSQRLEPHFVPAATTSLWLQRTGANLLLALLAASWWVMLEFLRGWLLTGFGWNGLGVALWQNLPLLQGASLGGVLLLSGMVALVNAAGAAYLSSLVVDLSAKQSRRPSLELGLALLLTALAFAWGWARTMSAEGAQHTLRYVMVQPNIPQEAFSRSMPNGEKLRRHVEWTQHGLMAATMRFAGKPPEVVIWPEATTSLHPEYDHRLAGVIRSLRQDLPGPLIFGASDHEPMYLYTAAYFAAPGEGEMPRYRKNHLVVFGEYEPFKETFPFLMNLVPFQVGLTPSNVMASFFIPTDSGGVLGAPLICFEDTVPRLVRQSLAGSPEPNLLINITNDSWFKESPGAWMHMANAVPRTVETGLPMLRATNTGVTAQISPHGIIQAVLRQPGPDGESSRTVGVPGALAGELSWSTTGRTLYLAWGDWPAPVAAVVCLLGGLYVRRMTSHG